jgi:hypothetical protein
VADDGGARVASESLAAAGVSPAHAADVLQAVGADRSAEALRKARTIRRKPRCGRRRAGVTITAQAGRTAPPRLRCHRGAPILRALGRPAEHPVLEA